MGTIRDLVVKSWQAAERVGNERGAIVLTAASMAGWALTNADGDAVRATAKLPNGNRYWSRVRGYLDQVEAEDRQARGPRLQVGT